MATEDDVHEMGLSMAAESAALDAIAPLAPPDAPPAASCHDCSNFIVFHPPAICPMPAPTDEV
jgi:hypothetical protein